MDFNEITILGGRGNCMYCNEMVNNVGYHEGCQCDKRPRVTGLAYQARRLPQVTVTKDVEYECGCVAHLTSYGQQDTDCVCQSHGKPVQQITTVERFH